MSEGDGAVSTLILMRHGQASLGAARYDVLSPLGAEQAAATGRHLGAVWEPPTRALHGPRARHRSSWEAMAPAWPGVSPEATEALDELAEAESLPRDFGRLSMLEALRGWARGQPLPGVAPVSEFHARVAAWLEGVVRGPRHQRVLAVTSAGVIGMVAVHLLKLPDAELVPLITVLRNASLTEVAFSPGGVSLVSYNSVGHLPSGLRTIM